MNIEEDEEEGRIARLIREAQVEDSDGEGEDIVEATKKQMIGNSFFSI